MAPCFILLDGCLGFESTPKFPTCVLLERADVLEFHSDEQCEPSGPVGWLSGQCHKSPREGKWEGVRREGGKGGREGRGEEREGGKRGKRGRGGGGEEGKEGKRKMGKEGREKEKENRGRRRGGERKTVKGKLVSFPDSSQLVMGTGVCNIG